MRGRLLFNLTVLIENYFSNICCFHCHVKQVETSRRPAALARFHAFLLKRFGATRKHETVVRPGTPLAPPPHLLLTNQRKTTWRRATEPRPCCVYTPRERWEKGASSGNNTSQRHLSDPEGNWVTCCCSASRERKCIMRNMNRNKKYKNKNQI